MNKVEAIAKFRKDQKLFTAILGYQDADKFVMYHENDPELKPIKIMLPQPPDWDKIDGFGLPAKEQKFQHQKLPARLVLMQKECLKELTFKQTTNKSDTVTGQKLLTAINDKIKKQRAEYRAEIDWIKRQQYFMWRGYWCFINGKPTYIDGWHYRLLNWWRLDETSHTEYRDRDRRKFIFWRHAFTTKKDANGKDYGRRTCFGVLYPKGRRDGATHGGLVVGYDIVSTRRGVLGGIQSFDDDNAGEHFKNKLIPAWKGMPFFARPMWRGSTAPQEELAFENPPNGFGEELQSRIDYATTAKKKYYDGKKLYFWLGDEEGKTLLENVNDRWDVIKPCLSQGGNNIIHGFTIQPSTVEEMNAGGENFYNLCELSHYHDRMEANGQTQSGLFVLFMGAEDGLEGFIGPYGESIIDTPTPEQAKYINNTIGSRQYLTMTRESYLKAGTTEAMQKYRNFCLLFPMYYSDCFKGTGGNIGFNYEKLDRNIEELRVKEATGDREDISGNLMWIVKGYENPMTSGEFLAELSNNPKIDGRVEWFPEPDGRWRISYLPPSNMTNRRIMDDGIWYPENPGKFILGGDSFQFLQKSDLNKRTESKSENRLSDGGGAIFWMRDKSIDPQEKDRTQYISDRWVGDYLYRPDSDDEYCEDMLMASIFFGGEMYPEQNIKALYKHYVKRNFAGYLKYGYTTDKSTGFLQENTTPGYSLVNSDTKQEMFNQLKGYINYNILRNKHIRIATQMRKIKGIEYLNKFDLLAAAGGSLLGRKTYLDEQLFEDEEPDTIDIQNLFPMRKYS